MQKQASKATFILTNVFKTMLSLLHLMNYISFELKSKPEMQQ